jgi:transposase InsO family protein
MPDSFPSRSRRRFCRSSRITRARGLPRSEKGCAASTQRCSIRRSARYMRSSIATTWSNAAGRRVYKPGAPFASANSLFGLTRLSVWWLRLGIDIERIKPGHPQQNGRHERMHLTLKKEAYQAGSQKLPAATGPLRSVHHHIQPGAATPGTQHEVPDRALLALAAPLQRLTRARVPLPRSHHHRHALWQDLHGTAED